MELKSAKITIAPEEKAETRLDEFRRYKEETGGDYILGEADRLMGLAGDDPDIKAGVYTGIVKMLFEYPKEYQRKFYIKALGRRHKPIKYWNDEYKAQAESIEGTIEADNAPTIDADTTTLEKFGFYTEDNKYWFATQAGFQEGTNFVVEPLFHIYSMTNNRRLIRITNEYGYSLLCDVPSEAMVTVDKFQNFLYNEGNFLVFINNQLFKKLLRHIGEKFPKCFEIKTFGWQPEGFYAFADGAYNGIWQKVDEMGIVGHDGKKYFSPAFSKVYSELRIDDDVYENDRRFTFRPGKIQVKEWSELMQKVYAYDNNGQYGVAYFVAALFRSIVYNIYKIFPHLFLHGEKGSGKSQLGWSLSNIFQHGTPPFNLHAGTDVAFFRWLARYRDVIIWYEEYSDAIDEKRFQALKSAYDGVGREKGKMSRDSRTESDKINSAAVISGQHLPQRDDNSLYSRSIVRFFVKPKNGYTSKDIKNYDRLKKTEDEGLSNIITSLLDERIIVEKKFARTFSEIFEQYKEWMVERDKQIDDRIMRNYTILAAIVWIIQTETKTDLAINEKLFREMCFADALEQSEKVNSSDALATFWAIIGGLIQEKEITTADYNIHEQWSEKVVVKRDGEKDLDEKKFDKLTKVLYLDFSRAYSKYMEAHRRIYATTGLGAQTIMDYTHNHWSYIGLKASHYFKGVDGKRTSAHMFDYGMLVERNVIPNIYDAKDDDPEDQKWMGETKKGATNDLIDKTGQKNEKLFF